jgi:ParB family chromosome partitioning protein
MSEAAATPQPNAGAPTDESPTTKPSADDYLALKIADLDLKGIGNLRELDKESLVELTRDIKQHGVLEPVLVRESGGKFQLVAGFRRVAASKAAGLTHVPGRILELSDAEIQEVQLVENIQREGLAPLDEARAFQRYLEATKRTQQQLADRIGKSQAYVANRVRLLGLPDEIKKLVDDGKLTGSHAVVLASAPPEARGVAIDNARRAARDGSSVKELDQQLGWEVKQKLAELEFRKKVEASKFPKCPSCGKPATGEENYEKLVNHGDWSAAHRWNLTTGKTAADAIAAQQKKTREERNSSPTPTRDLSQPATARAGPSPHTIVLRMLEQLGPAGVRFVRVGRDPYNDEAALIVVLDGDAAKKTSFPGITSTEIRLAPAKYRSGEQTQVTALGGGVFDAKERRATLAAWEAWSKRALKATKTVKVAGPKADAKALDGNFSDVLGRLEKVKGLDEDPELLEDLRALEAAGKNRPSILERIDDWLNVDGENY